VFIQWTKQRATILLILKQVIQPLCRFVGLSQRYQQPTSVLKDSTVIKKAKNDNTHDVVYLKTVGRGQEFVLDIDHYPEAEG